MEWDRFAEGSAGLFILIWEVEVEVEVWVCSGLAEISVWRRDGCFYASTYLSNTGRIGASCKSSFVIDKIEIDQGLKTRRLA